MASGRLRLNRRSSQLQQPPSKALCIAEENPCAPPPLEATSHWILNDRLLGQLQQQAGGTAAAGGNRDSAVHQTRAAAIAISDKSASDVIVIGSSQDDDSASDSSFVSQGGHNSCGGGSQPGELAFDGDITKTSDAGGNALEDGGGRVVAAPPAVAAVCRDDGTAIGSEEQLYTFGDEEEFLSQAAVARWQQQPEAHVLLDDDHHETYPQPTAPLPAQCSTQALLAFLALHNLDTLLPTLLAHEVTSIGCVCALTHSDISCAAPTCKPFPRRWYHPLPVLFTRILLPCAVYWASAVKRRACV